MPAIVIDGRKVQLSRTIAQELDRLAPEPPLFPADPEQRDAVLEAERFGDEELQSTVRPSSSGRSAARRRPGSATWGNRSSASRTGSPPRPEGRCSLLAARLTDATDENARAALATLPEQLQRVDDEIAAGTIGGEQLNAADFQIGASLRLAMTAQDLRPLIDSRPAGELARRAVPEFAGDMPPTIPRPGSSPCGRPRGLSR